MLVQPLVETETQPIKDKRSCPYTVQFFLLPAGWKKKSGDSLINAFKCWWRNMFYCSFCMLPELAAGSVNTKGCWPKAFLLQHPLCMAEIRIVYGKPKQSAMASSTYHSRMGSCKVCHKQLPFFYFLVYMSVLLIPSSLFSHRVPITVGMLKTNNLNFGHNKKNTHGMGSLPHNLCCVFKHFQSRESCNYFLVVTGGSCWYSEVWTASYTYIHGK